MMLFLCWAGGVDARGELTTRDSGGVVGVAVAIGHCERVPGVCACKCACLRVCLWLACGQHTVVQYSLRAGLFFVLACYLAPPDEPTQSRARRLSR